MEDFAFLSFLTCCFHLKSNLSLFLKKFFSLLFLSLTLSGYLTLFSFSAIGSLYSDAGLLGAMVVCEAASAGKIVSAVVAALRSATVTEAEVAAAKKNLIADVYAVQGTAASLVEDIGTQVGNI